MRRSRPLLTATIDLYGGSTGAVVLRPRRSRWPEHEGPDRLLLPVWLAALTLAETSRSLAQRVHHRLMEVGKAVVDVEPDPLSPRAWSEAVAGRELVAPEGEGWPRVVVRVVESVDGPVPTRAARAVQPLTLAAATAAVAGVALDGAERGVRLSAAIAIEGLLSWHRRDAAAHGSLARGCAEAVTYSIARLDEAGSPIPEHLALAEAASGPTVRADGPAHG